MRCAAFAAKAPINGPRRTPITLYKPASRTTSDNLNEALLARLAHLQPLSNLFEGGNWSRDGYGAAHANILDQIDHLIYGQFR
jgi:hypothetical protein